MASPEDLPGAQEEAEIGMTSPELQACVERINELVDSMTVLPGSGALKLVLTLRGYIDCCGFGKYS
jgi:hypothetical protein